MKVSLETLLTEINYHVEQLDKLLNILSTHYNKDEIATTAEKGLDISKLKGNLERINTFKSILPDQS